MNWNEIREQFPALKTFDRKGIIYLDNASTTQKPQEVIDAVVDFYTNYCSNVHRGVYRIGEEATERFNLSRENIAEFVGANGNELVFVRNTTEALNLLANSLGNRLNDDDEIILSNSEHHSNIVPWQMLSKRKKIKMKFINSRHDEPINSSDVSSLITQKTKIVSLTECSNILGNINNMKEIATVAHDAGAVMIVDGAQSVPHMP
ncbi:Aminotransferase, class V/Cysteine desulfurase, partial [mine drainage metagenome]